MARGGTVIFDGECAFCIGAARFIVENDSHGRFKLAASQSKAGSELLREHGLPDQEVGSLILIGEEGSVSKKSTATLKIARGLNAPWSWLGALLAVPRGLRDFLYSQFAKRRHQFFGRREDACFVPSPEQRERFLL